MQRPRPSCPQWEPPRDPLVLQLRHCAKSPNHPRRRAVRLLRFAPKQHGMLLGLKRHSCPGGALACDTPRETFWRMLPPRRRALSPNRISGGTHRAGTPHVQAGSCCLHAAHCCTGAAETPPEHCPVAVHLCRRFPSWGTPAEDHAAPVWVLPGPY